MERGQTLRQASGQRLGVLRVLTPRGREPKSDPSVDRHDASTSTEEAMTFFQGGDVSVETALLDVRAAGAADAFGLARWIRARYGSNVVMVGAIEAAARKAKEICESGPTLARPYEHTAVVTLIKRLRAERDRRQRNESVD